MQEFIDGTESLQENVVRLEKDGLKGFGNPFEGTPIIPVKYE